MNNQSPQELISTIISSSEAGTIFVASDFIHLANNSAIRKSLSRLSESGLIRRIIQGVYEYPMYSDFLGEYVSASPHKVAMAIASKNSWTIVPDGLTALNLLGLSSQVPAVWTYVSTGPYKNYVVGKNAICFKRTASKDISMLSYKSALIAQAIKAIGKGSINDANMKHIARLLSDEDKAAILVEGRNMTTWVYEILKSICNGEMDS